MGAKKVRLITVAVLFVIVVLITDWLNKGYIETTSLVIVLTILILSILLIISKDLREKLFDLLAIVGEDKSSVNKRPWWHIILVLFPFFILTFYTLLGDSQYSVPTVLQFNIITVSATLGGLVLAAATIPRKAPQQEILAVAQKLIVATILFLFSAALMFLVQLLGGINPNAWEWTFEGIFRAAFFWLTVVSFFPGLTLFSIGIIDLILVLRNMRKR